MADQIREYVIKIKADVQEALKEIDQLSGKFDKIEIKTNIDKNFESRMKSIQGSIAKVIQEVNSLKSSFKDVDSKQLFNFKDAFSELQGSIDQIKKVLKHQLIRLIFQIQQIMDYLSLLMNLKIRLMIQ